MKNTRPLYPASTDLTTHLDAFVSHARELMEAHQKAPEVFRQHFKSRVHVQTLVPVHNEPDLIASGVTLRLAEDTYVRALLLTRMPDPQRWRVEVNQFPIAERVLADRSEQLTIPDTERKPVQDGPWSLSVLAVDPAYKARAGIEDLSDLMHTTALLTKRLTIEGRQPGFQQAIRQAQEAKYGLSSIEGAADDFLNAQKISDQVSNLLDRISQKGPKQCP